MYRYLYLAGFLLGAVGLLALAPACGGDDTEPTATPSPAASGPPGNSSRVGGVEAARHYLQETGIDGRKGDFTDPISCLEITDKSAGRFCIHEDFSTYAPGLVILRLSEAKKATEPVWEMRLANRNQAWEVTSVQAFGADE